MKEQTKDLLHVSLGMFFMAAVVFVLIYLNIISVPLNSTRNIIVAICLTFLIIGVVSYVFMKVLTGKSTDNDYPQCSDVGFKIEGEK